MMATKNGKKRTLPELMGRYLRLKEKARRLYAKADRVLDKIIDLDKTGIQVKLDDGRRVVLADHFATRNVCFRPAAIRRFDVVEVKETTRRRT